MINDVIARAGHTDANMFGGIKAKREAYERIAKDNP